MTTIDEHEVVLDEPGHVFHGLTLAKARVLNAALIGRRVILVGGQLDSKMWSERREAMFYRMTLPGERAEHFLSGCWELVLYHYNAEHGYASGGSSRHISASLVERLIVVEAPELCPCWNCYCWWPQGKLRDTGRWYDEPGRALESRLECRGCAGY